MLAYREDLIRDYSFGGIPFEVLASEKVEENSANSPINRAIGTPKLRWIP
jgi:hypothetical protein